MTTQGFEGANTIRKALAAGGFDWDNGKIFLRHEDPTEHRLVEVNNSDPRLDGQGFYFATDKTFGYMAAFVSVGQGGIFPAKVRKDSVDEITVNLDLYFEDSPLKDLVKDVIGNLKIISAPDVQGPNEDLTLHIVGSKDVPFFVVSRSEERSIRLFMDRFEQTAKQTVANRRMVDTMIAVMMQDHGEEGEAN